MTRPPRREWQITDENRSIMGILQCLSDAAPPFFVTFQAGEEKRRTRQNSFVFEAYSQIADMLDDHTASDVRAISKLHVGVPILRAEDEAFRAKYDERVKPFPYEQKLAFMVEPFEFPVTSLMSVRQMSEYIRQMLAFWDQRGASVMLPDFE